MSAGLPCPLALLAISLTCLLLLPEEARAVPLYDEPAAAGVPHPFHAEHPGSSLHNDSRTTSPKMTSMLLTQCESATSSPIYDLCFVTHYSIAAAHGWYGLYKYQIDSITGKCSSSKIASTQAFGSVSCTGAEVYLYNSGNEKLYKYDFFTHARTDYSSMPHIDSLAVNSDYLYISRDDYTWIYLRPNLEYENGNSGVYERNIEDVNGKSTMIFTETVSNQVYQYCYWQSSSIPVCKPKTTEVGPFAILNNDNVLAVHEDGSIRTGFLRGDVHTLEGDINDDMNTDKITVLSVTHTGQGQAFMAVSRWNGKGSGNTFEVYTIYET